MTTIEFRDLIQQIIRSVFLVFALCAVLSCIQFVSYGAAPGDENYNDDAGYSNATTQFTVDSLKYTLTGPGPDTLVTNVAPSGWGELGDGGSDNYISILGIDTLKIESADGSYFKLNGFEMGFCSVAGVTITPETGAAITRARAGDESYYTIDVSANTDFQYIRYFTISGTDMIMNIDDIDFSPAVPPTHTITYNGNGNTGGSAPTDGSSPYTEGVTVTALGNTGDLVRTGYTFAGWNTAANGSGTDYAPASTFAMGTSNITLYAKWAPLYTVVYNGNSNTGGSVPTDSNSYLSGSTVTVLDNTGNLVRTGYTFAGWNTAANGSGTSRAPSATFAMGGSNVTLYAQWTPIDYTVTYNGNTNTGGSVPTDGNAYHITETVTVLGNTGTLVKTGYTFAGWNTAANGSGSGYSPGNTFAMGSSNVTLYAQWTENTYGVTYNGNSNTGGVTPTDGTVYYNGDTATVLGNTGTLVRTGYTFAGWNTAANGSGTGYTGGNTFGIGLNNVTLYAQWTPIDYTVTYNGNTNTGGSVPTDANTYHITNIVTVKGNTGSLLKTGYTFAGWNTAANGSGTSYSLGNTFAMGSGHVTLYAQWTENTYAVTYNGNNNTGGVTPTDGTVYHNGDIATVLGNTGSLVRTGYTFAGWNTGSNGSGTSYTAGDTFAIGTSDVTLYAQWTAINYSVTYNGNTNTGGSVPTDGNTYHIADSVTVLGNTGTLVKTGYTFAGWNTVANGSGTNYSPSNTFTVISSNVTLYAQWTEIIYSVTYNGNSNTGGSVPTDVTSYHDGDTVTVLSNTGTLVRTGYTFAGWNTAANGGDNSYTVGDTFAIGTNNVTLYAQWTAINYSVTYNGNTNTGGSVPTDGNTYHIADSVTVLGNTSTLVKTGYTFAGWNTAANGSGTSYNSGNTFALGSGHVTLYAQWTENVYSTTYNGNSNTGGSTPTDGTSYHTGDTATVLGNTGNLVRMGYNFAGWNTAENGSGTAYAGGDTFAIGTSNVTLYAQWTAVNYSVTYNGNTNTGGSLPTDGNTYHITDSVTVLGNTGTLVKTGYTFAGWNTAANGSGTTYAPAATFAIGSSNVTLYAQWTENVYSAIYDGNSNTGGVTPTDATSYHNGDTATVLGNTGALVKSGYTFAGWNTAADGNGTTYLPTATFAMGSSDVTLFAKWSLVSSGGGGSGGSSGGGNNASSSNNISTPSPNVNGGTQVLVNGLSQDAGTSNTVQTGSVSVTTVSLDATKIDQKLTAESNGSTVTIPVINNSDVVIGQLNGQTVKNMENKEAVLEIKTSEASYTLPAQQINITDISNQLGQSIALKDITVSIEISSATPQTAQFVENIASKGTFTVVAPPVEFTVRCSSGGKTVEVNSFNAYVERTIAIPPGVDPSKVTTGVVIGTDGTVHHVPTRIVVIDGKYFAQINSLTNSVYALVNQPITFKDLEKHWSKSIVNNMGSRMIATGTKEGNFEPSKLVTHAEFTDLLVKSLGLTKDQTKIVFKNKKAQFITRQEAAVILEDAIQLVGIKTTLTNQEIQKILSAYKDGKNVSKEASKSVALCIKQGIIKGSYKEIRPNQKLTKAEAVVMLNALLKKAKLI